MKQTDNKSLLHFVFKQMKKLETKEITVTEAQAQSNLAKQANNSLAYEIKRTDVLIRLRNHNFIYKDNIEFREIEDTEDNDI